MALRALLWDVDGTLAETERDGHRVAFNAAFETLGLPWRWSVQRYGELLAVTGGFERLLRDMATQPDAPPPGAAREALARQLHGIKNGHYARLVAEGGIALRDGVRALMDDCAEVGLPMAITTTTSRSNVDALLGAQLGAAWQDRFAAVLCAEDAPRKKPDPQVYTLALQLLDIAGHEALAVEDSPAGVQACAAAGVPVVVTRSVYFAAGDLPQALAVGPSLGSGSGWALRHPSHDGTQQPRIGLAQLRRWHGAAQ
jgi:beta-phosphoglucomutase-like phosphatase (HAD superfamily)